MIHFHMVYSVYLRPCNLRLNKYPNVSWQFLSFLVRNQIKSLFYYSSIILSVLSTYCPFHIPIQGSYLLNGFHNWNKSNLQNLVYLLNIYHELRFWYLNDLHFYTVVLPSLCL